MSESSKRFPRKQRESAAEVRPAEKRYARFSKRVDRDLCIAGVEVRKTAFRAPNTNAFVERFIQSVEQDASTNS